MYRFLVVTGVLTVAALVGVLAISSAGPEPDLIVINGAFVHDLDPARMSWMHDIRTAYGLWEGLLSMNPRTLTPEPAVAERYEVSTDGKVYTFHLRPDARWSNGEPVVAEDFRYAWFRVLDPANASDYYSMMFHIRGAEQYYEAKKRELDPKAGPSTRPDPASVGIEVIDEHTLRVTLRRPTPYFPELAAFATFLPVHRASMERHRVDRGGGKFALKPDWLKPGHLVTNGPFMLERWEFHYRLVLVANPYYWDAAHVASHRLELLAIPDQNTAFQAYQSGAADVLTGLPEAVGPRLIEQARAGQRDDLHIFATWGLYYYRFNCKRAPLDDVRVRKALAMSVDRAEIVRSITRRGERPQSSFVTPGLSVVLPPGQRLESPERSGPGWRLGEDGQALHYVPADGLAYDPPGARRLLAEAGYGPGGRPFVTADGKAVSLLINELQLHRSIAEAITRMWRVNLGVEVVLDAQISSIAGNRMDEHQFEVCRSGWFTDYGDPTGFLDMFKKDDGNNDGQFDVAEYDRLLDEAAEAADPARRFELLHRGERLLVADHAGVIPIYQYVGQLMFSPAVAGIWENPKQQIMLKYVGKKE